MFAFSAKDPIVVLFPLYFHRRSYRYIKAKLYTTAFLSERYEK
jgi:hypothetical protein